MAELSNCCMKGTSYLNSTVVAEFVYIGVVDVD